MKRMELGKEANEVRELRLRMQWMEAHLKRMENWLRSHFGYFGHLKIENPSIRYDDFDAGDGGGKEAREDGMDKKVSDAEEDEEEGGSGKVGFISLSKILTDSENENEDDKTSGRHAEDFRVSSNKEGMKASTPVSKDTAGALVPLQIATRTSPKIDPQPDVSGSGKVRKSVNNSSEAESIQMKVEGNGKCGETLKESRVRGNNEGKCNPAQHPDDISIQELKTSAKENIKPKSEGDKKECRDCRACEASFTNTKLLKFHEVKVHKNYLCKYCQKGFDRRIQLQQHVDNKHYRKAAMIAVMKRSGKKKKKRCAALKKTEGEEAEMAAAAKKVEASRDKCPANLSAADPTQKPSQIQRSEHTNGKQPPESNKSCPPPPQISQPRPQPRTSAPPVLTSVPGDLKSNLDSQSGLLLVPKPQFPGIFPPTNTNLFLGGNPLQNRFQHHHQRPNRFNYLPGRNTHNSALGPPWGVHHLAGNHLLICPVCKKCFSYLNNLQQHLQSHNLPMM